MTKTLERKDVLLVAIIIAGAFFAILNQTIMTPMLPSVMEEFGIDTTRGQWCTTIFMLVNGLMVPITAYLISRFSTRQLFFTAMLLFTCGTLVCASSNSYLMLLGGRVLQAVGAGIQLPFVAVTIMRVFPKERRGFALGINGIVVGCAPAFGPTFAGWVTDSFGWRYAFYSIIPVAIIIVVFALIFLRNFTESNKLHLDWPSVALSTLGFGGLLFGFSIAGSEGFDFPQSYVSLIVGIIALILFVRRELMLEIPMLNLRTLKNKTFATSTILVMIIHSAIAVTLVINPIFLQNVLGESAMLSGLTLMPGAIIMAAVNPFSGYFFDKYGPRVLTIVGLASITVSTALLAFIDADTNLLYLTIVFAFRMGGFSLVNMPLNTWGMNAVSNKMIAHANAVSNTSRQVAGSIGTAILITVMMTVVNANPHLGEVGALTLGINIVFGVTAVIMFGVLMLAIFVVKNPQAKK